MRASVLICTPDSSTERFKRCYDAVIATTKGISFDLRIVDNRYTKTFSQQDEINKMKKIADGPVINMDDDVIVQGNWFNGLLDRVTPEVGLICCNMTNKSDIPAPITAPATGLCCTLLNIPVWPNQIVVDTGYKKYFFDPDLCLQLWAAGLQVKVIPEKIHHENGGAMKELGLDREGPHEHDRLRFKKRWIDSGKYAELSERYKGIWDFELRKAIYS